jgi:hypothetical protein
MHNIYANNGLRGSFLTEVGRDTMNEEDHCPDAMKHYEGRRTGTSCNAAI